MPRDFKEQKVNYNTQVLISTDSLVRKFLETSPGKSKAWLTDEALKEYILARMPELGKQQGGE